MLEFYVAGGMTADEFAKVAPYLDQQTSGPYTSGLINVNTASAGRARLRAGHRRRARRAIVSTRQSQTQPSTNLALGRAR